MDPAMIVTHNSNGGFLGNKPAGEEDDDPPVPKTLFGVSVYTDAEAIGNTMMRKTKKTKKVKKLIKKKKKNMMGVTMSTWKTDKAYIDEGNDE